ncbi:MAG: hypothetical protein E7157_03370 [Lactobacillales bacterium]|nr:hypothetical protein [Lactobacillales bacterium]
MEQEYNILLKISSEIYDLYNQNDINKLKKLIEEENKIYEQYNPEQLTEIINYIYYLNGEKTLNYLYEYEIPLYNNKKRIIIERIINKLTNHINRSFLKEKESEFPIKDVLLLDNNTILVAENTDYSFSELYNKIITQVEIKYLYFVMDNDKLDNEKKKEIFLNDLFINPFLEEKLLKPIVNFADFVKEEDNLYNGLWDNIKETYNEYLEYQCKEIALHNIDRMLSEIDIYNPQNTIARSLYLRAVFNYLTNEQIEDIYNNYNEEFREINNLFGDEYIRFSFNSISKDKEEIEKIKTR